MDRTASPGKTVLITGATGFLGGYAVREFIAEGWRVVACGRSAPALERLAERHGCSTWRGDLADMPERAEEIRRAAGRIDVVVHCAALSTVWGPWEDFRRANVEGTQRVVDFCLAEGVKRMVHISSPSIYSRRGDFLNIREDDVDPSNSLTHYIRSKIASERIVRAADPRRLETVILRPRGIIGAEDPSILPRFLAADAKIGIPLVRGGSQLLDLTCVENAALSTRLAAEAPRAAGEVYNITNGEPAVLKEIIDALFRRLDRTPRYRRLPEPLLYGAASLAELIYRSLRLRSEPPLTRYTVCTLAYSQTLDISKARRDLGYEPRVGLTEGLDHCAEPYR